MRPTFASNRCVRRKFASSIAILVGSIGALNATTTAATFTVAGPATAPNGHTGDAILTSVSFDTGPQFTEADFRYVSSVTNLSYAGGPGEFRVVSGPQTSTNSPDPTINTTGFHRIETSGDSDASSISAADQFAFAGHVADAFQNRNLNNFVDQTPSQHFAFTIHFDTPLSDNDTGDDDFGELLIFERGFGGSNSYMIVALDDAGTRVGQTLTVSQTLINPRGGENSPQTLTPVTDVAIFDANGNAVGSQTMEGLALDLSAAFGVNEISSLRIATPLATDPGVQTDGHYDLAPDFKILGLDTTAAGGNRTPVPEPTAALLALPAMLLLRRRR